MADRIAELLPAPLIVAEFGTILEPEGSLPADMEGDGDEVEELIPFVLIPGGTGRFAFEGSDWVPAADGAISVLAQRNLDRQLRHRNALAALPRYLRFVLTMSI